jgi:4-hydroxy-tetrahydrodipicolinate synthase
MSQSAYRGVFPIAPTPFLPDGALDKASTAKLFDHYAAIGSTGLTVLGIMGEAPKLDQAESLFLVKEAVRAMGKSPIIVGVSAPGFAAMRALARQAMELGAGSVMIAPPNTLRTDDQIVNYYAQAIEAIGTDVPFVIQDYPLTLSVVMTPKVIQRIVTDNPSCVMLKHEDWPGLEMERGADGANTGYAFPEMLIDVVNLMGKGERDAAHDMFDAHLPLLRYEQQPAVGLAVRKYVMMRRGLIAHDAQRKPGAGISATAKTEVDYLLSRLAKHDRRAALKG